VPVTSFKFDPALTREFIEFGYSLYRDDARWIPPFRRTIARQLSPGYFMHRKPGNDHLNFLARQGGRVVGRASAMVNAALKDADGTAVGTVGFFECVEDPSVAASLLDAARDWLRSEHGIGRIWGPMNFDIWHGYRFLTRGFGEEPFYGEPANKPYYPDYFERYGFARRRTWVSLEVRGRSRLEALVERGKARHTLLVERGYRSAPAESRASRADMKKLYDLMTASFGGFLGFTPISFEDFERLARPMRHALAMPMSIFVYDEAGGLAGFALTLYELSAAVRAMKGREHPLSLARFFYHRRRVRRLNFYAAGETPEEQAKRAGLGRAGIYYVVDQALRHGYEDIIFALMVKESRVQGLFPSLMGEAQREYALYELNA